LFRLTSTDYSIVVRNPPPDAYDPDEWRDFFEQFAEKQVTFVTVGLNNDELINKLIDRRLLRNDLRMKLPKGTNMDDEDAVRLAVAKVHQEEMSEKRGVLNRLVRSTVLPVLNKFGKLLTLEKLTNRVFQLTEEIKELQKQEYPVSSVFVTFETEEGQRAALEALSVGKLDIMSQNAVNVAPSAVYHGRVLKVVEPPEPSAVRWRDQGSTTLNRNLMRMVNLIITLGMVSLAGLIVSRVRTQHGPYTASILVSGFNSAIPMIVKELMVIEPHRSEGSYQTSLYMKITLFRWINTAILVKFITPFTNTITNGDKHLIKSIHALLWSELWISPVYRLMDVTGNLKKHILAPRTRSQEEMNVHFQGTQYNLGERYTDMTKVLFLCFFYSALFPTSFFFGAAILLVQYYVSADLGRIPCCALLYFAFLVTI
jgi:Cytosolic domain of 10TM putative phosphate transporter